MTTSTLLYQTKNRLQSEQTASPDKYPQGFFKPKPCKKCGTSFSPNAPSHGYCSQACADYGVVSAYLTRTYGLTYIDYLQMLKEQEELCKICNREGFVMDADKHKLKLVVDHCHATGAVRGLLCHNCNRALGLFRDKIDDLQSAIDYLKVQRPSRKGVEPSGSKRPAPTIVG